MADPKNPGQFGNRSDTKTEAHEGGVKSSEKQDMAELGRRCAAAQSDADKAKGGKRSHGGGRPSSSE